MVNRDIMQLNIVLPVGKPQLDSGYVSLCIWNAPLVAFISRDAHMALLLITPFK